MAKLRVTATAQQMAERWATRMRGSVQKITDGVNAVNESPMEKAADRADAWYAGITEAFNSGKYQAGLRSVSLADWKSTTVAKIATALPAGVTAAQSKYQRVAGELITHINGGLPTIHAMPKTTLQDSINKAGEWIRYMSTFQKS